MLIDESSVILLAGLIQDAALGQAVLDGDAKEARFRAKRVLSYAEDGGLSAVARAAIEVVGCLGPEGHPILHGCGSRIHALSVQIDQAQTRQLT